MTGKKKGHSNYKRERKLQETQIPFERRGSVLCFNFKAEKAKDIERDPHTIPHSIREKMILLPLAKVQLKMHSLTAPLMYQPFCHPIGLGEETYTSTKVNRI